MTAPISKKVLHNNLPITHFELQNILTFSEGSATRKTSESGHSFFHSHSMGDKETSQITTVADVADSLDGTYFTINSAGNEREYYIWFSTGAGAPDPAPAGLIGIKVTIATGALDTAVAAALVAKLNAGLQIGVINNQPVYAYDFQASNALAVVTIVNTKPGDANDVADVSTGFAFATTVPGTPFLGDISSVKPVPKFTPIHIFNNTGGTAYVAFGTVEGMPVPTGATNGFPVLDGERIMLNSGNNGYVVATAAVYAYVAEDKGIIQG